MQELNQSFVLYTNYSEILTMLSDEDLGIIFRAILIYKKNKEVIELPNQLAVIFALVKNQLDLDELKYNEKCQKNSNNGKKGGAPVGNSNAEKTTQNNPKQPKTTQAENKTTQNNPKQPKTTQNKHNDNENENDNDNENENVNDFSFKKEKKEKKEKSLNFSEKENFKNSLSSFCENNFNLPSSSYSSPFKEDIHSKPPLLEVNRREVYPYAPDLEDFEGGRVQIVPPLEEEGQLVTICHQLEAATNCSQLEPVTDCNGLNKGELCPNAPDLADVDHIAHISDMVEGEPLENSRQTPQNPRPRWDKNYDLMYDTDVNKVFEIYKKECKNLIPLGYERRDTAYRQKIKEFLDVISGDFAYFTDVCRKANELKAIELRDSRRKIDLKTLINCHARIFSGFYKTESDTGTDYLAIAEAAQKRYEENYK